MAPNSQHDFARVVGGASSPYTIVDVFEDGDVSEYNQAGNGAGNFSISTANPYSGTYSGKMNSNASTKAISDQGSGLNYYPQPGDTVEARCYVSQLEGADSLMVIGADSVSDGSWSKGIGIGFRESSGNGGDYKVKLYDRSSGGTTTGVSSPLNEHLLVTLHWGTDDTFTSTITDESGNEIYQGSLTTTGYDASNYGFGFFGNDFAGNRRGQTYWDMVRVR